LLSVEAIMMNFSNGVDVDGLHFVDFISNKDAYMPEMVITDSELLAQIKKLPLRKQQTVAELIVGRLHKHSFYVSKNPDPVIDLNDLDNVPFFYHDQFAQTLYDAAKDQPTGALMQIDHPLGGSTRIPLKKYTKALFKTIDGQSTLEQCFEKIKNDDDFQNDPPADQDILVDFKALYDTFILQDFLLLRHRSVPPFPSIQQIQQRFEAEILET